MPQLPAFVSAACVFLYERAQRAGVLPNTPAPVSPGSVVADGDDNNSRVKKRVDD